MIEIFIDIDNVPETWALTTISDFTEVLMGQSPPSNTYNDQGIGLPFFQGKAEFTELYPIVKKWCNASNKIAEVDNILLSVRAPVGTVNIANVKCCIGRGLSAIKYTYCPKFVFYYFKLVEKKLDEKGTGTTFRAVSGDVIRNISVYLPPLSEQHRIVAKIEELFSSLDKGIKSLKTAQTQLKIYRQAVLKWAFEGKLTNDDVKEGELPEGWKWSNLEKVAENLDRLRRPINKTERSKRQGEIPYYGANGRTGWINEYLFDEPLILVVEDETFIGREIPFSYKITGKSWINNHAHILRPKMSLNIDFLNYQLAYYPFLSLTTGTTGRKKLTKNALMNAQIKICSLSEQVLIVSEIESRLSVCDKLEESINQSLMQAEALRQSILKKAFEGKLVPQDPNDEPASVLLKRIRAEREKSIVVKKSRAPDMSKLKKQRG